ncbi:MAG: S8 family serine peptidase [Planctomycetota bacterium]
MRNFAAAFAAGVVFLFAGVTSAASQSWFGLSVGEDAVDAGVVPGFYVVRVSGPAAGAGGDGRGLVAGLPSVADSRPIASGLVLSTGEYHIVRLADGGDVGALEAAVASHGALSMRPVIAGKATTDSRDLPNDPFVFDQYAILNEGQMVGGVPGVAGADVRAAAAWQLQRGSAQVRVAVIDSGVSATHPDLVSKLDDGVNITGGPTDDTDSPFNTHGTHIAGIVAASTNNSEGVVGVSWGSRLVPIKAANPLGFTSDVWLAEGLLWAADNDVDVAVMSFGLSGYSDVLADAVRYAHAQGVIVVASSGNTGSSGVLYPAAYPEVIAVGATDNADALASFSTTGPEIEFVAPGVSILSTTHTMFEPDTYDYSSGTSVSTPIVAGVAALMRSANPEISVGEVRRILAATARDLGDLGRDEMFGYGRVNAQRALQELLGIPWCYADVDGNGDIRPTDFTVWSAIYLLGDPRADQNRDGVVTPGDFNAFVLNYLPNRGACFSD